MQKKSTTPPPQDGRRYLRPLEGGPWLDDCEATVVGRVLVLGGLAVVGTSLICGEATNAVQTFWFFLLGMGVLVTLFGLRAWWGGQAHNATVQTCPECLREMPRGATTCPHCHFRPPQGETQ